MIKYKTEKFIQVYCLVDPRNNNIFYVGLTTGKLKNRLSQHCSPKPYDVSGWTKKKEDLIENIILSGYRPVIHLLKTVPIKDSDIEEKFFYELFTRLGFRLLQADYQFQYTRLKHYKVFSTV